MAVSGSAPSCPFFCGRNSTQLFRFDVACLSHRLIFRCFIDPAAPHRSPTLRPELGHRGWRVSLDLNLHAGWVDPIIFASPYNHQVSIRQRPLQRLRFIPWRSHPHVALFVGSQDHRRGFTMNRRNNTVRLSRQEYVEWAKSVVAGLRGVSPWLDRPARPRDRSGLFRHLHAGRAPQIWASKGVPNSIMLEKPFVRFWPLSTYLFEPLRCRLLSLGLVMKRREFIIGRRRSSCVATHRI
jgi:hypothetical protein